jgi:hypothetical protein
MKLSYSEYKNYIQCPMKYYKEVNNIAPPEKPSKYFRVYGLLTEYFFKIYTNKFSKEDIQLRDEQVYAILRKLWTKILDENFVEWTDPWCRESSEHIFMSAYEDVLKNLNNFDFWKNAQASMSFEILLKKSQDILSCCLDFLVNNPDGTIELIDGKGTYSLDKAVDVEQVYFYILIYYLHYKKLPDKAGYLYYKFQTIRYIDFDMNIIMDFKNKLALVKSAIKKDKIFEAKVGISKQCKWCDYRMTCEALIQKRQERAEKKKPTITFDFEGSVLSFSPKGIYNEGSD